MPRFMAIFIFSAIRYMAGTKMSVRKVAKLRPKIMVQESGPQNITLSPPKWSCGLSSVNMVTKFSVIPIASGTRPSIVAVAVSLNQ